MFKLFKNLLPADESETKSDSIATPFFTAPDSWEAQVAQADTLWEEGKHSEALAIYRLAIRKNPRSLAIQQRLAERLKQQGDLAAAYERVAAGLKNQGNIEQAANYYRQAINIKALTGNTKEQLLRSSISKNNKSPIPIARLKDAAFSFQPLTNPSSALIKTALQTSDSSHFEVEADKRYTPSFTRNLKTVNPEQSMGIDWETAQVYLQKALDHLEKQEWEQSAIACKQATQILPNMAEAYKIWGNALQRMGKTAEAMFCYAEAVEIKPNLAEVYSGIAYIYAQQQKWQQAIKHYQKAIIIKPSAKVYRSLANIWQQLGEPQKAQLNIQKAMELESSSTSPPTNDNAQKELESATLDTFNYSDSGHSVTAYRRIAQKLEQQEKWQLAAKYYRQALDTSLTQPSLPPSEITDNESIKLDLPEQLPEQLSEQLYEQLPELADNDSEQTEPKTQESQLNKAIRRYRKQTKLQPKSAKIYTNLGSLYERKGQLQYAAACYRKAIEINPRYAQAHLNLAMTLLKVGKQPEFIKEMQLALALQPKIGSAIERFYLGNALINQGQQQQAISCYYKAIVLDPRFIHAYHRLSKVFSQQGKHNEAIKFLEQGINHNPEDAESYYLLGQQFEIQQKWDSAVKAYSKLLQLEPQFPEASQKLNHALAEKLTFNQKLNNKSSSHNAN